MSILKLDINSGVQDYQELFSLDEGEVFEVDDFDTIMERIDELKPDSLDFEVFPITPGTDLFITYGANHCVVIKNEIIEVE